MLMNFGTIDNPTGDEDPGFARFKKAYPRQEAMLAARREWYRLNPDEYTEELILQALSWQVKTEQWRQGMVPRADRYLRDGRWMDEQPKAAAAPKLEAYQAYPVNWAKECLELHQNDCPNAKAHMQRMQQERSA